MNDNEIVEALRTGILRWVNRPENEYMRINFAQPVRSFYLMGCDTFLFDEMDAPNWIARSGLAEKRGAGELVHLWNTALVQVTAELCPA